VTLGGAGNTAAWWGDAVVTTFVVEALFAMIFARVLVSYVSRRDPLQRDVALMFSAVAVLFVVAVGHQAFRQMPALVDQLASLLLLGQPFLTVRLVRRVGGVPAWVYWSALVGWILSAVLLLVGAGGAAGWGVLAMVATFVVTDVTAALLLARLARERRGAPRTRLRLAAAATGLFAAAVLAAGSGSPGTDHAVLAQHIGQGIALVSAVGYLLAFAPPGWARRRWSDRAAYTVIRNLIGAPADAPPEGIWQRYAEAVCHATGSTAAVVLLACADGSTREAARVGILGDRIGDVGPADRDALSSAAHAISVAVDHAPAAARPYARAAGAHFVTLAPLNLSTCPGLLLLFNRYRSLFSDDDVQLLGELSGQAAALAQRGELLTERERLAGELSESVVALTAASKAKSDFMANMSHELRTPLNAIIGFSDLMSLEPSTDKHTVVPQEWVEHIRSSGEHLLALINEVLDLAKIEAGKVELRLEPLDLPRAIDEVVTSLDALIRQKDLDVTVAIGPLRVHADRVRFRQVMTNLLSNAIKFTPKTGRIYLAARRIGPDIAISVADTGPGIAGEDLARVFEEFQQSGDTQAKSGGTGLGLAVTRRLVHAHAGRIEVESEVGDGTRFTVYLPAVDASTDGIQAHHTGPCAGVLVIEDDAATARLLATYLEGAGYQVTVAATGEQGLLAARAGDPEVILLDIHLPGVDGWQILTELKHDSRLRHIPVVIISAFDDTDVGLALGAVDYMVKPVDRQTLLSWLARRGLLPPGRGHQNTVLAIDDDPASLRLIDANLSAEGIHVVCASGGAEGLRLARTRRFGLIICDLIMPDVDGFDVIAALHNNPATRGIPVVVVTAHTLTDTDKARLSGKVIAVTAKDAAATGLAQLARTVGQLSGLTIHDSEVTA
jgi:signal transduction histidine kinase/CheY-like chemotaxis protein